MLSEGRPEIDSIYSLKDGKRSLIKFKNYRSA